jgi:hypothetical protein
MDQKALQQAIQPAPQPNPVRNPTWVALILTLGLSACVFDSRQTNGYGAFNARQWVLPAKKQSIDLDTSHWLPFAFSEGNSTVTLKIPPHARSFHASTLPRAAFDQRSQRRLLDVEYDYRSKSIEEMAEFQLQAWFVRLPTPLPTTDLDADALNRALRVAWRRSQPKYDEPAPELITANGRQWIHLDGTDDIIYAFESYGTLIDPQTVFFISGWYWQNIRKDPAWFESRRALLRAIRDNVRVSQ